MSLPRFALSLHALRFLAALALLASAACTGSNHNRGDRVGTANAVFKVEPALANVLVGQTVQFRAYGPWGQQARWSVVPATGGTFTADGLFTAAAAPGQYRIVAMWNDDVRYTALASATVMALPMPATSSPEIVQASGVGQGTPGDILWNAVVVGEPLRAMTVEDSTGTVRLRHGFSTFTAPTTP
ncbi:hypothetical protein [Geothrix sp. 21YS21S-4]|uniref:hypothetical protein n=1 Tax=Geothrix sp. 21YS21S-4 TaxID=3068889 RepID=UPI0027BB1D92|nr:hypothetical protein [Geothrix sp. 21YS21S-4]